MQRQIARHSGAAYPVATRLVPTNSTAPHNRHGKPDLEIETPAHKANRQEIKRPKMNIRRVEKVIPEHHA